jgi:hypothetical protein
MREMNNAICIVIVNYNAGDALLHTVSTALNTQQPLRLIVVDNASSDGSCGKLSRHFAGDSRLEIIENAHNLGFARAVNACAMDAGEPFLLILNPDCELCPGALSLLKAALEQDAEAGLAAPKVMDSKGRVSHGTWRSFPEPWKALMTASGLCRFGRWFPALRGVEFHESERPERCCRAEAVSGACMMLRTSSFRRLGGLDEKFGLHFEDLDLMYRLRRDHQYCLYVPSAVAIHQQGISSRSRPWWVHRQKHLGLQRFFCKHYAGEYSLAGRWFVRAGIWLHYGLTLPLVPWSR